MNRAKLSDVARAAGVSVSAVGFAVGDNLALQEKVSPETRKRILKIAADLDYRPHKYAQMMLGKKSGLIGIIKPTGILQLFVERSFFVAKAIQAAGYGLMVSELLWDALGERRAVDAMLDAGVEGALILGHNAESDAALAELHRFGKAKIPVVSLGGSRVAGCPLVTTDYQQGMRDLTNHLLALGYRRLTYILPVPREEAALPVPGSFSERLAGFQDATAAAGLGADEARVFNVPSGDDWADVYSPGQHAVNSLIKAGNLPQVLVCNNDTMAIGALAACADAGLRVPDDIAITGFDDTMAGRFTRPALTSVSQPAEAAAKRAVELLVEQIRGGAISDVGEPTKIPCRVVVRESCGAGLIKKVGV